MHDPSLPPVSPETVPPQAVPVPAQRSPLSPLVTPETPAGPVPARRRVRPYVVAGVLALVAAVAATIGVVVWQREPLPVVPAAAATTAPPKPPLSPFEAATAALTKQAEALLAGDERGWLAAVDPAQPKLQARYRTTYRSLRALGVSQFVYWPYVRDGGKGTTVALGADISYCFSMDKCPDYTPREWAGPPRISQILTLKPVQGRYVIASMSRPKEPNHLQPTPWENGAELVFAQGTRVTVAASRSQAGNLARVLAIADKAAAVNDRFAAYVGNPQKRYRIYLADDKSWKSWYGGQDDRWTVGYAVPLNDAQTDVVLRTSELLKDRRLMATTIQHELGHVVTIGGVSERDFEQDRWLSEGIAEYIGWTPRSASASWRRASVHDAFRSSSRRPRTIAAEPPGPKAGAAEGDAFYGLGHFAVDCMAEQYGEPELFEFVRLALRNDNTYDQASRDAFGKPFAAVDKACLTWIRETA